MGRATARVVMLLSLLTPTTGPASAQAPDPPRRAVWPGRDWEKATPVSRGMSPTALDAAAAYAEKAGGGSGCIIRHGYLVKEWGDPGKRVDIKSATKGTLGATLLGLAVDAGLVGLDDMATKHNPQLGIEVPANPRDRLGQIRVRHLATMTAGFDDGRPPKLTYRPGTSGIYSNDGANMLAELLTLRLREDLSAVFKRKIMDPIGAPPEEWAWRANSYRAKTIDGLASREFASGLTITHRTLARIGYLYLRDGEWDGRRLLSRDFIREATRPADLPTFVPYYAFFWGTNGRGTFPEIPRDTFWALGLGDSVVVVCPSLDLVAVRLGVGSKASQLPAGKTPEDWGGRVAGFFRLVVESVTDRTAARPPYPPSPVIKEVRWAPPDQIRRAARGSDNWPLTWADDGHLYTAYGDGNGFEPQIPDRLGLGFARVEGGPADFRGVNIRSPTGEQLGSGPAGRKASGLLMVDGVLYLWTRNVGPARLARSADHGRTWTWADWGFATAFACPTFLNFGRDYAGARDGFVYVYSHDGDSAYRPADRMILARVPKGRIMEREAYEFFAGLNAGSPTWTRDLGRRGAVFTHEGKCYRSGISYNAGLGRYLWCQILPGDDPRKGGGFGLYDAPEPWGPWTTAFFTESWDVGPGETSSVPTKWISPDGTTIHLVFSGDDCFSVRQATLVTGAGVGSN
jgi:CubicO group peptidase (beta-lactamase class C family)